MEQSALAPRPIRLLYLPVGLMVIVGVLFGLGLLSDRWIESLKASCLFFVLILPLSLGASRSVKVLIFASVAFIVVAAGSFTRDCLNGTLFRHGPTALCVDGTYSYSHTHQGTCSWHHGVQDWQPEVPWWKRM